jgi:hypothetical protein
MWSQALVLVLVGMVLLQGPPVDLIMEMAPTVSVCTERGYCPRNPDGPCECEHHASHAPADTPSTATDGPAVMRSCDTGGPDALAAAFPVKWVVRQSSPLLRRLRPLSLTAAYQQRTSQWAPNDIVRPPWAA